MKVTILLFSLFSSAICSAKQNPGLTFLIPWTTARPTALAGAMTGLADEPDAVWFNPAGLAFQSGIGAVVSYCNWLPGLYPGMHYAHAAGHCSFADALGPNRSVTVGCNAVWFTPGKLEMWIEPPPHPVYAWDLALGLDVALTVSNHLGLGLNAKFLHSEFMPDWVWEPMPELGIDAGGTGSSWAIDLGLLYRPLDRLSAGLALANIGPDVCYQSSRESDPLPWTLKLGLCWTPLDNAWLRLRVLPELDKVLVGMFYDPKDTMTLTQKLRTEFNDAWKSLGIELSGFNLLHLRLGYFEDLARDRGGVLVEQEKWGTKNISLFEYLFSSDQGRFKRIGICWGIGIGYQDYVRLDVSSDAAIYDFATSNWKFTLVAPDVLGAIAQLSRKPAS